MPTAQPPILGDIPLLGLLFKHKKTENEKKELLIFMTPHIVKHPTELAAHSESERTKVDISHGSFSEQELDRYFDKIPPAEQKPSGKTTAPKSQK